MFENIRDKMRERVRNLEYVVNPSRGIVTKIGLTDKLVVITVYFESYEYEN